MTHTQTAAGCGDRGKTKATLAGLTDAGPASYGRSALFDDSISLRDVPGSLHLATDDHIERMIARTGAVKLIRQFARDLAMRDAEISSFRVRADQRERELKKMLREANVTNQAIEHRLYMMENDTRSDGDQKTNGPGKLSLIDRMMNEAMDTDASAAYFDTVDVSAAAENTHTSPSLTPRDDKSAYELSKTKSSGSLSRWGGLIWGPRGRQSSRASSAEPDDRLRSTLSSKADAQSPRQQPSNSTTPTAPEPSKSMGDDASIRSNNSKRSWTKLFGGGGPTTATPTDKPPASTATSTKPPAGSDAAKKDPVSSPPDLPSNASPSTIAVMRRMTGGSGIQPLSSSTKKKELPTPKRTAAKPTVSSNNKRVAPRSTLPAIKGPQHAARKSLSENPPATSNADPTSNGPVEMDAILPLESKPPALNPFHRLQEPGGPLTDRFGFIYDQRRKTRQRQAEVLDQDEEEQLSALEQSTSSKQDDDSPKQTSESESSPTPTKTEDQEGGILSGRKWQNYLKTATMPTELLSHTPSPEHVSSDTPSPKVTKQQRKVMKSRHPSVSIDKNISVATTSPSSGQVVTSQTVAQGSLKPVSSGAAGKESEPVKLLLERLTDLHDILQEERTVKWNEFLRKVRAERRKDNEAVAGLPSEQRATSTSAATPEAFLADGEVIGIAGLGNKGKVGRAKWQEFRRLVLGGIPVSYRAKIWSECSGASELRVPGLYDELVKGEDGADADEAVVAQIETDIHRTLTDNVFFRKGPGVQKLHEVLLAYSRRNPKIGYCQGMNLIAGSLLLTMPTAEDAFWVLVSLIENILPPHYYDQGLLASRADQSVLRQYVSEILPSLSSHLDLLGIELEALTFQWFLSVFTDCLSAEALYRVWDVVLCLNPLNSPLQQDSQPSSQTKAAGKDEVTNLDSEDPQSSTIGGGSTFFFQVAVALLKLNEQQLLTTCPTPAAVYTYINHQMTNHAISIDGLIQASEALRNVIKREDVAARRAAALKELREAQTIGTPSTADDASSMKPQSASS
ncbi:hypothetical protein KEM56_002016 [Ascosphaera pollenicola]|nr:hypothetical protein KEM56_002016 [Ascosphaera pollenicola]